MMDVQPRNEDRRNSTQNRVLSQVKMELRKAIAAFLGFSHIYFCLVYSNKAIIFRFFFGSNLYNLSNTLDHLQVF